MLTFIESISLAGDRTKQNDDAFGFTDDCAWVIDGATDLHDKPISGAASDAAWFAQALSTALYAFAAPKAGNELFLRQLLRDALERRVIADFHTRSGGQTIEGWQRPMASMAMAAQSSESADVLVGLDLGDCRCFVLDAAGSLHAAGGPPGGRDAEASAAARQTDAEKPLLERTATIELLRRSRNAMNRPGAQWTVGLDPDCASYARAWRFDLVRPAHVLLMTDGFALLADQYRAYDAAGLVRGALSKGLQELGRELRAIEADDADSAKYPRFKASDDATALLMRLM